MENMANIFDQVMQQQANPTQANPRQANPRQSRPRTRTQRVNPVTVRVNQNSALFDNFQLGTRDDPTKFALKDILENYNAPMFSNLDSATCRMFIGNCVAVVLYSFDVPVAAAYSNGHFETLNGKISDTSDRHIKAFVYALTGMDIKVSDIRPVHGVPQVGAQIGNAKPVNFPRVTVGMLNKAIKDNGNTNNIKVTEKNGYNIVQTLQNGNVIPLNTGCTLKGITKEALVRGYINIDQLKFYNRPDQLQKFYRKSVR